MAPRPNLDHFLFPKFTPDAGERMRLIRMNMLIDQRELGMMLGTSQQQISKLESGRLEMAPFTYGKMQNVFGELAIVILIGSEAMMARMVPKNVSDRYWFARLVTFRKNRSAMQDSLREWFGNRYNVKNVK